jgi:long-subunit acyl-CoA synthetase (AMP-forming)
VGERIRKFIIQEDICSTENGLLTPTQKIKRAVVLNRNSERISELY